VHAEVLPRVPLLFPRCFRCFSSLSWSGIRWRPFLGCFFATLIASGRSICCLTTFPFPPCQPLRRVLIRNGGNFFFGRFGLWPWSQEVPSVPLQMAGVFFLFLQFCIFTLRPPFVNLKMPIHNPFPSHFLHARRPLSPNLRLCPSSASLLGGIRLRWFCKSSFYFQSPGGFRFF